MKQFLTFGISAIVPDGAPYFCVPTGADGYTATLAKVRCPVASTMNVSKLYVHLDRAAGTGKNVSCTVMQNGVATPLTVICNGAVIVDNSNLVNTILFAESDEITIQIMADSGTLTEQITWGFLGDIL